MKRRVRCPTPHILLLDGAVRTRSESKLSLKSIPGQSGTWW